MAMFRKFFYRKPPDGLLEISERVYVFDCCFTTDILEENEYKVYLGCILGQLCDYFPEASFMVFNFREGENRSLISHVLSEYDMTVMDYPRHYEGCPLLTMEMIHHFLRSSESWLSLGQQNVLLMHCERGGWPVLAFMLAALLLYRKQFTGEQKTLDMIYKQAPRELLQLMSPLNPLPSQLRYLKYVSRRNVSSEWPPLDRALTLDCIILRTIPSFDGKGGCRPIFRIYGQDPLMVADRTPKVLFSTPKKSKLVRHYKQADCELVKIDIHCHIQGDVVLECISLDSDQEREEMMFRVMFNTAFIRSNILMLNCDEIDILWDAKDQFPKDFRAEVLFSEMDTATSLVSIDLPGLEEKDGLPIEAFAKVHEIFSNVDWLDPQSDVAVNMLHHIKPLNIILENLETGTPQNAERGAITLESVLEKDKEQLKPKTSNNIGSLASTAQGKLFMPSVKRSLDANSLKKNIEPQELQIGLQRPAQSKIISQRLPKTSLSASASFSSLQGSPLPGSRYHSAPSSLGITALLHDHDKPNNEEVTYQVTRSLPSTPSSPVSNILKPLQLTRLSTSLLSPHPPPPPPQPSSLQSSLLVPITTQNACAAPPPSPQLASKGTQSLLAQIPGATPLGGEQLLIANRSVVSPLPASEASTIVTTKLYSTPPLPSPSPRHSLQGVPPSSQAKNSFSTPPPPSFSGTFSSSAVNNSFSTPPPPPPPPPFSGTSSSSSFKNSFSTPPPPPSPPPFSRASLSSSTNNLFSAPPPPLLPPSFSVASPSFSVKNSFSTPPPPSSSKTFSFPPSTIKNSFSTPPPPPPPPPLVASSADSSVSCPPTIKSLAITSAPPPPPPPPLHSKGHNSTSSALPLLPLPLPPPPPPPTPSIPAKVSLSNNSAHAPPVPPPPALPVKGLSLSKACDSSPSSPSGVSNCNIPPVPGPPSRAPFSAKDQGLTRASPRNQSQPRKNNLKPYHWLKLTRAMQGSLWAEAQKPDEASKAPEFDMSELESLFSAAVPNSDNRGNRGKSSHRVEPKSEKVHLIEFRRAYNCEIMLSKVKIPLPDLTSLVLALDDSVMDVDQVDNLIKFCPTKEEMELLKNYKGDKENLGKCERFFLELMKVPRIESKLRVFSFKMQFHSQVSDLRKSLNIINSASEEVRNSVKLKRIMQTILSLGNALNHGTARGAAVGFRLDSLLKLTDTRARNNKMTLMHYLCKVLAEKLPELLDFVNDLVSLEASTKIQLKFLAEEMQAISKGLEKVVQELSASENDGPVSENFCKILKQFLSYAEGEVRCLASLYSSVGRNADALAQYFGEDPARCPFEQVVSTLLNFVRMFVRAHKENCKQLELEKKKVAKVAENEKLKRGNSKKQSEHLIQSPLESSTIK